MRKCKLAANCLVCNICPKPKANRADYKKPSEKQREGRKNR